MRIWADVIQLLIFVILINMTVRAPSAARLAYETIRCYLNYSYCGQISPGDAPPLQGSR